jgi:hypothetical protein
MCVSMFNERRVLGRATLQPSIKSFANVVCSPKAVSCLLKGLKLCRKRQSLLLSVNRKCKNKNHSQDSAWSREPILQTNNEQKPLSK